MTIIKENLAPYAELSKVPIYFTKRGIDMKKSALVFAALSMLAFLSCSQKDVNKMRSIAVSGTGKVIVTPDKATVKLAVITRKSDIKEAQEENAKAMKKIQDALLAKGVTAENLQTYDYEISQESHWKNDERVYGLYCVTNRIKVTVQDIEKAGDIIDLGIRNGATCVDGISFSYEDEVKAIKRARTLAIENARAIAEESVSVAGTKLGKVLTMKEQRNNGYGTALSSSNYMTQTWLPDTPYDDAAGASTPISSGKKEISIVMDITYELK